MKKYNDHSESFFTILKADYYRYFGVDKIGFLRKITILYHRHSFINLVLFRIIQYLRNQNRILSIPVEIIYKIFSIVFCIQMHFRAKIGKGFYIGHWNGIFIGPVEIGKYCSVFQQVSIGHGGRGTSREGTPKIGNYVWIGPGAKISGKISIGNHVRIGPNSVVTKDILDHAVVAGNPGRIVGFQKKNIYLDNIPED